MIGFSKFGGDSELAKVLAKSAMSPFYQPQPDEFEVKAYTCIPCGLRVLSSDTAYAAFMHAHVEHVREYQESFGIQQRPIWRSGKR